MKKLLVIALVSVAHLLATQSSALANAPAPPPEPELRSINENSVRVCLQHVSCADQPELLRMNQAGTTVLLDPASCQDEDHDWAVCFVDECVPVGTYRYGLRSGEGCSHYYPVVTRYVTAEVTVPLGDCQWNSAPPQSTSEVPLWSGLDEVERCDSDEVGCSLSGAHGSRAIVGGQLLAALLGLALVWRRRRRG